MRAIITPRFCLPLLLTLTVGCATQHAQETERDSWLARHGGTINGPSLQLARSAADPLVRTFPQVQLRILNSPALSAYSWPDGTIALSRGLVESFSSAQIAATVAHELGHLVNDGWVKTTSAFIGYTAIADEESRADATAIRLLAASHQEPAALATALRQVLNHNDLSEPQRQSIELRIQRLQSITGR